MNEWKKDSLLYDRRRQKKTEKKTEEKRAAILKDTELAFSNVSFNWNRD